ncbi:bZIP transcription factor 39-like isoform X2 [Phalaenopsis equestris]|uniref:bZIP transcription factor 39-like isoform X2 n=1 Tax=Phalaenopsis equestris TaxID=78828 RepID=UPI0009E39D51|nr:bZIP transcription factor 39-like isoform X2 [Phalaenopsis equestris]
MPEFAATDPFSPQVGLSFNPDFLESHFLPDDLCLPSGGPSSEIDLDFDFDGIDWDISVDDLLLPENANPPSHPSPTSSDGWLPESVVLTSSSSPATSGIINITSPESDRSADCSTESSADVKREVGSGKTNINPRSSKSRRLEDFGSCRPNAVSEEEEKKKARLIRNRESAQLSRQRKKEYVEELEDKVRSMSSTIAELNSKISFIMAENLSLKQQLGGSSFPPGVYPPPSFASSHFSWAPYPPLVFRQQISPVPLVPIPKLKSQQAEASQKTGICEKKKRENKVRKVASISLLGFLFFVLIYGGLTGRVDHRYQENRDFGEVTVKNGLLGYPKGMVLSVSGRTRSLTSSEEVGFNNGRKSKSGVDKCFQNAKVGSEAKPWPFGGRMVTQNSSESLPACLYVPRNGKHVEINGNLIISSVLASEKAVAQVKSRDQPKHPSGNDVIGTGLVIANLDSGVALSTKDIGGRTKSHGSSTEYQGALASDAEDACMDNSQDGFLEQWFQEGMAGPIFSSGTCTEVFQFQISPSSASPSAVITSSIINATKTAVANSSTGSTSSSAPQRVIKNRKFFYPRAIPLPGSTGNHTKRIGKGPEGSNFQSNASGPPMVVSVLIDPREVSDGDGDGEGKISPNKSLQRIFVVILLDSVKYITYSCVLPFKSYSPHLVN